MCASAWTCENIRPLRALNISWTSSSENKKNSARSHGDERRLLHTLPKTRLGRRMTETSVLLVVHKAAYPSWASSIFKSCALFANFPKALAASKMCSPSGRHSDMHSCLNKASKTVKVNDNVFLPRAYLIHSTEVATALHSCLLLCC